MQIKYTAIIFQFDPTTDTDFVYTRQELISGSISEAYTNQDLLVKHAEPGFSYRSYIQERQYTGKFYRTEHIHNFVEIHQ